jgi:hypothetical protein
MVGLYFDVKKIPVPQLNVLDPAFHYDFKQTLQGAQLAMELDVSHLNPTNATCLTALIKKYWTVFDVHGTFTPVCGYQYVIDTVNAKQQLCARASPP